MARHRLKSTLVKTALLLGAVSTTPAQALVVHPGDDPPTLLDTPVDSAVARWGGFASATAISPQHVLLTQHQGGGVGSAVRVGGVIYTVAQINLVIDSATPGNNIDLRVARLETADGQPAFLPNYTDIYSGNAEVGQAMVLGGFGQGRGADVFATTGKPGTVVGYDWDGVTGLSRIQRWGANTITGTEDDAEVFENTYQNDILKATFESPGSGVYGEATLADGDSGGGWFLFDNGQWKLAGISQAVDNTDAALFSPDEEQLVAIRLSGYRQDILDRVSYVPGDVNQDWSVDFTDLNLLLGNYNGPTTGLTWTAGDFTGDGDVAFDDLNLLLSNYGYGGSSLTAAGLEPPAARAYAMAAIPEPSSLALLSLGGLLLTRRRRN